MGETGSRPDAWARWRASLLAEADIGLGVLAEQYLARPMKGWDREAMVSGLSAFLSSPETRSSVSGLLDRIDILIVGLLLASGGLPPESLGKLVAADLAYHELEYRLANLQERLLVFRAKTGEYEVTPHLAPNLAAIADAGSLFGPAAGADRPSDVAVPGRPRLSIQELAFIAWALLREGPDPVLKAGGLSSRAKKRILELAGGDEGAAGPVAAILEAMAGTALADPGESIRQVDQKGFAQAITSAGDELPYLLAASRAGMPPSAGMALKAAFAPFLEVRFEFSDSGLDRFTALAALGGKSGTGSRGDEAVALKSALLALGIVSPRSEDSDDGFTCVPERVEARWAALADEIGSPVVAVDGSGGVQVLPPASPADLAFLVETAILQSASGGWRFRLCRDSARRAFADGWTEQGIAVELERLSGHPLPQTLTWDLVKWRSEYDSVRIFRGQTLVLDPPSADLVEKSGAFARIPHEKIGGGFYFFGSAQAKAIEEALMAVGLPPPSLRSGLGAGKQGIAARGREEWMVKAREGAGSATEAAGHSDGSDTDRQGGIALSFEPRTMAENPEPALRAELELLVPDPAERRSYQEMLERKLVYTRNQLRAMVEQDRATRRRSPGRGSGQAFSAVGLDFNGKLRIIQAAFKAKFSRLDAKWVSGGANLQALVRPVSLRRTDRDYELEGENLSTGRPVTIRVGSLTYIGLKKGYYLGDR